MAEGDPPSYDNHAFEEQEDNGELQDEEVTKEEEEGGEMIKDTGPEDITMDVQEDEAPHGKNLRVRRRWRHIIGMVVQENRARAHHIVDIVGILMRFLEAAKYGDSETVEEMLAKYPHIDLNETADNFGNSPLTTAVKNDDSEVVLKLVNKIKFEDWRESILISISMDHDDITDLLLDTKRYEEFSRTKLKKGDAGAAKTIFPMDLTPLILAAIRNQFGVVRKLLDRGEKIVRPHHAYCDCSRCVDTLACSDELEVAKIRLYTYRGLASEAYISLSSPDPLLEAFTLRQTLLKNAEIEKYFKAEYQKIAEQLSEFSVKLLGQVRSGRELDIILRESTHKEDTDRLARLKLAIRYDEKPFVTHPSCQKKIQYMWTEGWGNIQRKSVPLQLLWCLGFGALYPFLSVIYWIWPYGRVGKFLETPVVKFIAEAVYFLVFVALLIVYTFTEVPSEGFRLADHGELGEWYTWYNSSTDNPQIANVFLRVHHFRAITISISIHILGYLWQIVKTLYRDKLYYFTDNGYNLLDLFMHSFMAVGFFLRYYTLLKVDHAVDHFSKQESWQDLLDSNGTDGEDLLYYLDADRTSWHHWDTYFVAEALYSYAVLPALIRATYILSVSETIGPLLISLKHMFMNFVIFMAVFLIVFVAFTVSFNNLYWYYDVNTRLEAETPLHEATSAEENYGTFFPLIRTMLFTLFGMTDASTVEISSEYKADVTLVTGYLLFGAYNWINVIIFLNMLIGMMAKAYDQISDAKDIEWKFDRTKLYLDYMKEGNTLCVPFNMMPTWWSIRKCKESSNCCDEQKDRADDKKTKKKAVKASTKNFTHSPYSQGDQASLNGYVASPDSSEKIELKVQTKTRSPKKERIRKKKLKSEYGEVIEKVRERFIVSCTTPGEDDAEDGVLELVAQMKAELTNFRHDMARVNARNEADKKLVFNRLDNLDSKLKDARTQLHDIMDTCDDTADTIKKDIRPEVKENLRNLRTVNEQVVHLKGDVHQKDEEVKRKLEAMQEMQESAQFGPIKHTLDFIQTGLEDIRTREAEREEAPRRKPKPKLKVKSVAPANYDQALDWEPFPLNIKGIPR